MTKRDKQRMDRISRLPCLACVQLGVAQPMPTEVHHIVDKGYRRLSGGNQATIPLCSWHHRGAFPFGRTERYMTAVYGPSMFHLAKLFALTFGTQRELLERVNAAISEVSA